MTRAKLGSLTVAAGLVLAAIPALAHHSFSAEYDATKPVTITGKFTSMDWINPHSWVHMDVTTPDGKVEQWKCETPPPNGLYRSGWRKNMLKAGDEITVRGYLAKDGTHTMWSQSVTFADGKRLTLGSSPGNTGQGK